MTDNAKDRIVASFRRLVRPTKLAVPVLLMALGSGWLGDGLGGLWEGGWPPHVCAALVYKPLSGAVLFFIGAWWMYGLRREYLPVQVLARTEKIRPARVLVMTVSRPNFEIAATVPPRLEDRDGRILPVTGELDADCEPAEIHWNWQPLLRGLRLHLSRLERIQLIGSKDSRVEDCAAFLRHYAPGCEIVWHPPETLDVEDIDGLMAAIGAEVARARAALPGLKERDVMLDCTGGPKPTSIAVALYTSRHPRLQFQYVSTNTGEVCAFNVLAEKEGEVE